MMFEKVYKCKMCGERIESNIVDRFEAESKILDHQKNIRHLCTNGDIGIAEFIGYKKIRMQSNINKKNDSKEEMYDE